MGKKSRRRKKDKLKSNKLTRSGRLMSTSNNKVWQRIIKSENDEEKEENDVHGS